MRSIVTGALGAGALLAGGAFTPVFAADDYEMYDRPGAIDAKVPDGLITGSRVGLIVDALEEAGFEVEVGKDEKGAPKISSTDKNEPFTVHFYGCKDGFDCGYIQFVSGWNMKTGVTAVTIEQWNSEQIWGQAYRDDDKDPWVAITVNLRGGITRENFADTVEWWADTMDEFEDHIGWNNE